ncbi:hypothetical protein cyc_02533 [Cyclospora cayetanensis]|uniref:Uncharacterized protein n=1 Tax=Cyclospora cayetanensis TaxID=88456 RepID=A0A1D3CVC6_9EIME|nr:hypothetical protein cyc_02533 [Cyclospora cayetanensis]
MHSSPLSPSSERDARTSEPCHEHAAPMSSHSFELSDPASGAPATPEGGEAAEGNGDDLQCSAYKNPRRTTPSPPSEAHTKVAGDAAFIPEDSILVFFPDDLNASGCALRCERKQQATRYQKESKVTFYGPLNEPPTVIRELEASAANAEAGEGLSCLPRQMENFLDCSNSCPHAESRAQHQIEQKALPDRKHPQTNLQLIGKHLMLQLLQHL